MITREDVANAALELQGVKFRHQGRDPKTGLDCCGVLHYILKKFGQPIFDVEGYRAAPSVRVIRETLGKNFHEIPPDECGLGDIYLLKVSQGGEPKHSAVIVSTETDIERGKEPMLLHTLARGFHGRVVIEPVRQWRSLVETGYRLKCLSF
jgi:cell wall-associated NlpC family hydrolase